jgi:hypothetical protein
MLADLRFVIMHGSFGSPEGDWFPWLSGELSSLGAETIRPMFPTPEGQSLDTWLQSFDLQVGAITESTVLVGHSISVSFILRLLERARGSARAAFLVAPFLELLYLEDFDKINHTFVTGELNWPKVRASCHSFYLYSSDNDPYVPLWMGQRVGHHLRSSVTVVPYAGHFNESAGWVTFERLLEDIKKSLNKE